MPMTPKEMVKHLEKHGFVEARQRGSHKFMKNNETGRCTTVPMHRKDLSKPLEKQILKDAGLN